MSRRRGPSARACDRTSPSGRRLNLASGQIGVQTAEKTLTPAVRFGAMKAASVTSKKKVLTRSSQERAPRLDFSGSEQAILSLQRTAGNRFVTALLRSRGDLSESESTSGARFTPSNPGIRRQCSCGGTLGPGGECESCRQERLSRKNAPAPVAGRAEAATTQSVRDVIRAPGQPLDSATREFMESRFGRDFKAVRVHTDRRAAESARAVNAHAYALGRNVVFAAGKFAPQSHEGRRLIAHELAHIVQQSGWVGRVDSAAAAEGEARSVARRIAAGESVRVQMSVAPTIQRAAGR